MTLGMRFHEAWAARSRDVLEAGPKREAGAPNAPWMEWMRWEETAAMVKVVVLRALIICFQGEGSWDRVVRKG